ncbi:MAG: 2-hydroxyacyl-CoA dehydratase [Phycisphaerales bacterium]|nr:MAG: 2-hydroxyacyl-CoA dehydratase [Phycisphaerales bacterium]
MGKIVYTCPYVPAEWVAAHGLVPSRVMVRTAGTSPAVGPKEGVCPYVRGFVDEVMSRNDVSGIVMTTVCDQMRRAFDIVVGRSKLPAFLMNVPNTWRSVAAQRLYVDELRRLSRFLVGLGGSAVSNGELAKVMLDYDTARSSLLAKRELMSGRQFAEMVAAFNMDGPGAVSANVAGCSAAPRGVPLAAVGGPMMAEDLDMFDVIEESGGRIVLDATESGERGICQRFDRRSIGDDPVTELAEAYFGGIQDASRRPNSGLYQWLKQHFEERGVRGVVLHRYVWCDMWHAELARLREWTDLPVLDVGVTGDCEADKHRAANQIGAFLEMLQ